MSDRPTEVVASRILRRAQVSKMTRALQNRLALANVKVQNGWGNLPLESLEMRIEQELKRKRPHSSGALSDTSSSTGDHTYSRNTLNSSPIGLPIFSDDLPASGSGSSRGSKRSRQTNPLNIATITSTTSNTTKYKSRCSMNTSSWKRSHHLPESSPGFQSTRFTIPVTIPDDLLSLTHSEEDDSDLPLTSFQFTRHGHTHIQSSPPQRIPRTPSPDIARSARLRSRQYASNGNGQSNTSRNHEDAADLLMFLAASPSPAVPPRNNKPRTPVPSISTSSRPIHPPSTPPQQKTPLPSSMLSTPGGSSAHFIGLGTATPGVGFNFSDYLNVTPSPAQAAWRTPGPSAALSRTPLAGRERKALSFDNLMPPTSNVSVDKNGVGLGMELGGELVSSQ